MLKFNEFQALTRIDEANFGPDKIAKVSLLYGKLFGKKFGGEFKVLGTETFDKRGLKGKGIRLINEKGYQVRFNFDRLGKGLIQKYARSAFIANSIDYWDRDNNDVEKPTLSVTFNVDVNIVEMWDKIVKVLKNRKVGEFNVNDLRESYDESVETDIILTSERGKSEKNSFFERVVSATEDYNSDIVAFYNKLFKYSTPQEMQGNFEACKIDLEKQDTWCSCCLSVFKVLLDAGFTQEIAGRLAQAMCA